MEKITKIVLWILSLLCLYAIGYIGLGWFWSWGELIDYQRVNSVFLNLSYSYLAGLIFYLLVSYFPYKLRQNKFKPIINSKIEILFRKINSCVVTFHTEDKESLIQDITLQKLKEIICGNDLYNLSYYGKAVAYQMNNFQFLCETRQGVFTLIESILLYREYMSGVDIAHIEGIKDSPYFNMIKVYETTPVAMSYYKSDLYKEELAKEMLLIINHVKKMR